MRSALAVSLFAIAAPGLISAQASPRASNTVAVTLTEWKIELPAGAIRPGVTRFVVTNTGSVPHGIEVEGAGIEKRIALIQPGATDTLSASLKAGKYELYCPVGSGSHKKLGMEIHFVVGATDAGAETSPAYRTQAIHLTGGGPVIQILPGPFPFADSVRPVLAQFGGERAMLESQIQSGPFSNNVAKIAGTFSLDALDRGAVRDSVTGDAQFTTQDGVRWHLVLDRVQTRDLPHHPRFGGVIFGLYYHGATGVHTPLVPTITSTVALWSVAHLYRNDVLVTDNAMVHVMLLSHTRRDSDFGLACWDCSKNRIDELQLQVTPAAGEPKFGAPGGFLFVNWEHSSGVARTP